MGLLGLRPKHPIDESITPEMPLSGRDGGTAHASALLGRGAKGCFAQASAKGASSMPNLKMRSPFWYR